MNENVEHRRKELLEEYADARYARFQMRSLEDYDRLRQVVEAQRKTGSHYVRDRVMKDIPGRSNGESGIPLLHQGDPGGRALPAGRAGKTVCLPGSSWSWPAFWRTPPAFTAVNSSSPPIPPSCWPCGGRRSMTWTRTRWSPAAGPRCPVSAPFTSSSAAAGRNLRMRTAPRTDRGAVSFVEKAILGGAPPLFHAFLCLLRMFLQPGDSIGAGGGGGAAVFTDLLQGGPDQLIRHPLPRREGSTKVWSMV